MTMSAKRGLLLVAAALWFGAGWGSLETSIEYPKSYQLLPKQDNLP